MDVGFDTIGNATLICYDRGPVLATDPWIVGNAYFGSWGLSHEVPAEQAEAVKNSKYVWISHGHPDHLNADSESFYLDKKILLPDHVGGRIRKGFQVAGLDVTVLKDRVWHRLSDRIQVCCLANHSQDGILLVKLNGRLLVNMNDAHWMHGWLLFIRGVVKRFDKSFLLRLTGHGCADMINFRDEEGRLALPINLLEKQSLHRQIRSELSMFGTTGFVPFSSMHRYQRKDSIWAQEHVVPPPEYRSISRKLMTAPPDGSGGEVFPAFIQYCCKSDTFEELRPCPIEPVVYEPEHFGDNWADELDKDDAQDAARYFKAVERLRHAYDFVNLRVGARDNMIDLGRGRNAGLTFEAPRHSLMAAIRGRVFDDMLIGNYMRTTRHGPNPPQLRASFTRYVAKYADNGGVCTKREIREYMAEYLRRAPVNFLLGEFSLRCKNLHRPGSTVHRIMKAGFYFGLGRR